jgi:K+-sensing histidine kinase KdpD
VQLKPAVCALNADAIPILLRNLVENAMRYTPAGGSIQIALRHAQEHALLEISDSGPGIPAAMRERVFERFVRLADASQPGSGLGLSIVRQIAEMHGASISLGDGASAAACAYRFASPSHKRQCKSVKSDKFIELFVELAHYCAYCGFRRIILMIRVITTRLR